MNAMPCHALPCRAVPHALPRVTGACCPFLARPILHLVVRLLTRHGRSPLSHPHAHSSTYFAQCLNCCPGSGLDALAARAPLNDDALISMGERWGFIRQWAYLVYEP